LNAKSYETALRKVNKNPSTIPSASNFPTAAPEPGVLIYESFGYGRPTLDAAGFSMFYRPKGAREQVTNLFASTTLHDFEVEW